MKRGSILVFMRLGRSDVVGQAEISATLGERYAYHKSLDSEAYSVSHISTGVRLPTHPLSRKMAIALVEAFDESGIDIGWQDIEIADDDDLIPQQEKYDALGEVYRKTVEVR